MISMKHVGSERSALRRTLDGRGGRQRGCQILIVDYVDQAARAQDAAQFSAYVFVL